MTTFLLQGQPLPVTSTHLEDVDLTHVSVRYRDRPYRFGVQGRELPFEVTFLYEPAGADKEPHAWLPVAPESALEPSLLQEHLYPQLVELHERELAARGLSVAP